MYIVYKIQKKIKILRPPKNATLESLKSIWLKLIFYLKWVWVYSLKIESWNFPQDSLGQIKIVIIIGRKSCIQYIVYKKQGGGIFIFRGGIPWIGGVFARNAGYIKFFPRPSKKSKAHISQFIIFKVKICLIWVRVHQTIFESWNFPQEWLG